MPNRIIREAILTSEAVCSLAWPDEVFYRRLMSVVDDYGRHEANPQLLRSKCYPLQTDAVRVADITRSMAACQKAGVIVLYEVLGKQYLEVSKFGQQQRSASKCPAPTGIDAQPIAVASRREKPPADAPVFGDEGGDVDEGGKARKRAGPPDVDPQVWADWVALRKAKRANVSATAIEGARSEAAKAGMSFDAFLRVWCRRGSTGLEASWLKPEERGQAANSETPWQRSQRERVAEMTGGLVSRRDPNEKDFIDALPVAARLG